MSKNYAGIGSRQTPKEILELMEKIGYKLAHMGWTLQTGACKGADQSFAHGALKSKIDLCVLLCLPWDSYERHWVDYAGSLGAIKKVLDNTDKEAFEAVDKYHPVPEKLSQGARRLHARNHLIMDDVKFVICWTPDGKITGGTGQALREAIDRGIPIRNLGDPDTLKRVKDKLGIV